MSLSLAQMNAIDSIDHDSVFIITLCNDRDLTTLLARNSVLSDDVPGKYLRASWLMTETAGKERSGKIEQLVVLFAACV